MPFNPGEFKNAGFSFYWGRKTFCKKRLFESNSQRSLAVKQSERAKKVAKPRGAWERETLHALALKLLKKLLKPPSYTGCETMVSLQSRDFPDQVFIKHKSKMSGDCFVFKFLWCSVDGKHLFSLKAEIQYLRSNFLYFQDGSNRAGYTRHEQELGRQSSRIQTRYQGNLNLLLP